MKFIFNAVFGIFLRVFFFYSPFKSYLKSLFLFPISAYSVETLHENYVYSLFKGDDRALFQNKYTFISGPLSIIYNTVKNLNEIYALFFFILCDLSIAILLKKSNRLLSFLKEKKEDNNYLAIIYLLNPVSVINCISFRLDIVYTLINLFFISTLDNPIISPIFMFLSFITSPGYLFINFTFSVFSLVNNCKRVYKTYVVFFGILFFYFIIGKFLPYSPTRNLKMIYANYFLIRDSQPNFGYIWTLLPGTFLKYQTYTKIMLIIYQFTLSFAVMLLANRVHEYKYKNCLVYALIFLITHIIDRYPCENHYIVVMILLFQHWDIIKTKILNLAVYCSVAGYTLIVCRGFPYTHRKTGTSNYLFYQNLTYIIAMTFILMCSITGIDEYRKNEEDAEEKNIEGKNEKQKIE